MSKTKVSMSDAAKMAGVSRATFYRHIEDKGISTEKNKKGAQVVDISELLRVYGDDLKSLEDVEKDKTSKKEKGETPQDKGSVSVELEVIRERLKNFENERERERQQLTSQIEDLRSRLEQSEEQRIKSEEQKDRLTLMLTDQRSEKEKVEAKEKSQADKFNELEATIRELKTQQETILKNSNKGFFAKMFGTK